MRVTWLGHSSVLIDVDGASILADPVLRPRVAGLSRVAALPRAAADVMTGAHHVDAVLISHLHHDHCDLPTLRHLNADLVLAPPGAGQWLSARGIRHVREAQKGYAVSLTSGVRVTPVSARHPGGRTGARTSATAVGHLVEGGGLSAWLVGDTGPDAGVARLASMTRAGRLDLAVVPVWGWGPNLGAGHLDPEQAAHEVVRAQAHTAIPVHWGTLHPPGMRRMMRDVLTQPGPKFASALARLDPTITAHVLDVGGQVDLTRSEA